MAILNTSSNDSIVIPESIDKPIIQAATQNTQATEPTVGATILQVTDNPMGKYLILGVLGYLAYKFLRRK